MTIEHTIEDAGKTIKRGYERAVGKAKDGAELADRMLHRNTYNTLAAGVAAGFLAGLLVGRSCRCQRA